MPDISPSMRESDLKIHVVKDLISKWTALDRVLTISSVTYAWTDIWHNANQEKLKMVFENLNSENMEARFE